MSINVKILGCRGSVPASGPEFVKYGGATSCVALDCGGHRILLDGGTGLMRWNGAEADSADMLITHAHADHITGMLLFPKFFDAGFSCRIYGPQDDFGADMCSQFKRLMSTPLWPVECSVFRAHIEWHDIGGYSETRGGVGFDLGGVHVTAMDVNHPGGTVGYRVEYGGNSVVYMPDVELCGVDSVYFQRTADFARGCGLLITDGAYDESEYERYRGFGHSTVQEAAALGLACGAGRTLVFHHAATRRDEEIKKLSEYARRINPTAEPAAEGMTIELR